METPTENTPDQTAELIGAVSKEQIAAWKKEYGEVSAVMVDGHVGYLKYPKREIIGYSAVMQNVVKQTEALLKDCWLGGSEALRTNDRLFMGLHQQIYKIVNDYSSQLVKL